jgi:hypothetical protein
MQNENIENQTSSIRRNPTRNNPNVNREQNEKFFDQKSDLNTEQAGRISGTASGKTTEFSGGPEAGIYDDEFGESIEKEVRKRDSGGTKSLKKNKT